MYQEVTSTVSYYWNYYVSALRSEWNHLTPTKYAIMLVVVCVIGFVMMKSKMKSA